MFPQKPGNMAANNQANQAQAAGQHDDRADKLMAQLVEMGMADPVAQQILNIARETDVYDFEELCMASNGVLCLVAGVDPEDEQ